MIKTDIVAYVSSYALEGELIVPSAVLTSTPQEEEINLTYTPNFQLKLMDKNSYAIDDVLVSFSYADTNYTAYMNVVNRTQDGIVTLQYNNGLVVEKTPQPEPEPEPVDPLDSMLTIAGPLTPDSNGNFDSIVYSYETQDVYMRSAGMTYDSDNNRYEFALDVQSALMKIYGPTTHTFETVTFVNLDSTYKSVFLQMGNIWYGVVTDDGDGNLMWTRTIDYDPTVIGYLDFDFTQVIQQLGETMTCDEIRITMAPYVAPEPPRFTSPVDGDTITETLPEELHEYTHPIELEYGDGTPIPYNITSQCVTCDNSDVTIEPTEGVDENGQSYISAVYMHIQVGTGTATLTYENPDTGDTCTATFNYDISAAQPEYVPLDVMMMTGNEVEWQSPSITDYIEVTDPNQDDPETGEPPLRVTGDCTFSCDDSNITINGSLITASAPGEYEIIAQDNNTGRVGSVIWTITEGAHEV